MRVSALLRTPVATCAPTDNLASIGCQMWTHDCGLIPMVDADGKAVGVITDRDICIALSTRGKTASQILAAEVAGKDVFSVRPEDDIEDALNLMADRQIRRVTVTNAQGKLVGILSLNDVALAAESAGKRRGVEVSYDQVGETLKAICRRGAQKEKEEPVTV